jgi:hypothetical protein
MLYTIYRWLVVRLCWRKRRQRREELRRHIKDITDPLGYTTAIDPTDGQAFGIKLFERCRHISEHYIIPLPKAGFNGDIDDLFEETGESMKRYEQREQKVMCTTTHV